MVPAVAVQKMRTGSVIVDLAAETGGNCELTVPGEVVEREGVTIIGLLNLPASLPVHASQMYARVVQNFLGLLIQDGAVNLNMDDEIIRGMCITRDGEIVQEQTRKVMGLGETAAPAPAPEPEPEPVEAGDVVEATDPVEDAVDVDIVAEAVAQVEESEAEQLGAGDTEVAGALEETVDSVDDEPIAMPASHERDVKGVFPIHETVEGGLVRDPGSGRSPVGPLKDVEPLPTEEGAHDPRLADTPVRVEDEYVPGEEEVRLEEASEPEADESADRKGSGGSLA